MSTRRKAVLTILILLAVLILVLAVAVPRLADIDRYRPEVIARIERGSGRSAKIAKFDLTILPVLAIRADNIAIGNPPGFPAGSFLEINRAYARLDPGALLHRRIVIRSLQLEAPRLSLISDRAGRWNTEGPARARVQVQPSAWQSTPAPATVIARVTLEHGRLTAANVLPSGELGPPSVEANGISAELKDIDTEALGLHLTQGLDRGLTGGSHVKRAQRLRPLLVGVAWAASSFQGGPESLPAQSPRGPLAAKGRIAVDSARFGAIAATGIKSGLEIHRDGLLAKNIVLQLFGGQVTGDLLWTPSSHPPRYASHLALAGIDMERALLNFPSARGKLTGKLDGSIGIAGWTAAGDTDTPADPLANLQGEGAVTIHDGSLPAIRLNRDLTLLMKSVVRTAQGSPDPSTFRSLSADFEIGQGEIRSRQIVILGNGINLNVSGSVAIAGAGKLDYRGTGEITARQSVGSLVAGLLGSTMGAGGKITFPFTLTGTLIAPRFEAPRSPFLH
jgi:uncharacterized protein involved in outer membrane biogenesis